MTKVFNRRKTVLVLTVFILLLVAISFAFTVNAAEESATRPEIEVYLIAGQSNAVGYGEVSDFTATDPRFTNGFENVLYYGEGEHWDGDDQKPPLTFVPTTVGLGQSPSRVGAEIGIASALGDNGKMNAIIKCAWGGTSIYNTTAEISLQYGTWTSPTYIKNHNISTEGNKCGRMYTWFLETVSRGLDMLEADGYTPVLKGIWWMQGEAETAGEKTANAYNELLTTLINDMRRDLTAATGINQSMLPFVMGEITRNPNSTQPDYLGVVCQAQLDVAEALDNVFVVDTTGLAQQDAWHYTADAQLTIGERFVETALAAGGDIPTAYGVVPQDKIYAEDGVTKLALAVFKDGKYINSYSDWNSALAFLNSTNYLKGKGKDEAQAQIVLIDDFTAEKFDNTSQLGGTLVIDLNGHTLTTGTKDHMLNGFGKHYAVGKICDTNIIFENGNFVIGSKKILTSFGILTNSYSSEYLKTFSYRFDNVKFGFAEGATATTLIAGSANDGIHDTDSTFKMKVDMEFNNCVFDLSTNAPSGAQLFKFAESTSRGAIVQKVRINGGKIIKSTFVKGSLYTIGTAEGRADSVTFGKYDGHYTQLELPSGVTPAAENFADANVNALGNLVFAKTASGAEKDIYELTCLTTKYGTIPNSLASIESYPFVLFKIKGDGTLEGVSGYSKLLGVNTNDGAFAYAKSYLEKNEWSADNGYTGQKTAVIFQRCDYTTLAGEVYENMAQVRGAVTYDLNGYKLSQNQTKATSIFKFGTKPWITKDGHAPIFPTTFNIINGNIEIYSAALMVLQMTPCSSAGYSINDKIYNINYNSVTFSLVENATATNMFFAYWAGSKNDNDASPLAPYFISFNDCTFDLSKNVPKKNFKLFNVAPISSNYICNTVTVNGGTIKSKYWDNYISVYTSETFGSTLKFGKSTVTGSYTELELPSIEAYPSYTNVLNGKDGKLLTFTLKESVGSVIKYVLGESDETKYCYVPHRYADAEKYPYIVITYDKNGNIIQTDGFTRLLGSNNGAFNAAKNAVSTNKWNSTTGYAGQITSVILARRDYVLLANEFYDNFAQIRGEVTLDLDGYTLSQTCTAKANPLFFITSKPWEGVFPTTINILNGTLLTYNGAIFKLGMWTGTSSSSLADKLFTINLNSVKIGLCEGATTNNLLVNYGTSKIESVWEGKGVISPYFFNLTDCVIDLDTVKPTTDINIFNLSTDMANKNHMSNTVKVYGCEIKAESLDNINFVTTTGNGSSLTFDKVNGGNYASLVLSKSASAPSDKFNGGELVFVKVSENAETVTYRLRSVEISGFGYTPKTSITLGNELVMNVYIPVNGTEKFTFNDVTYENLAKIESKIITIDEKNYYHFAVALGSSDAAKEIKLVANVTVGDVNAVATFGFSIPRYSEKLIADGTDVEKTLAKDVLAYVKAAYNYFKNYNTEEEIARVNTLIDSILGDYKAAPTTSGAVAKDNSGIVTDVTLNLDAKPTIRFYVTDTTVSFYQNGKKLNTVSGTDEKYGAYVELDVYAYALCETITYADGGSYHISDFVKGSVGTSHEALVNAFVKYVESAADYRKSVINK